MKKLATIVGAAAAAVALSTTPASADLIYLGTTDTLGTGIGNQLTLLSFASQGASDEAAGRISRTASGDVIDVNPGMPLGGNNNQTRTLEDAGILNPSEIALVWNVNESDGSVNLQPGTLSISFYTAGGDLLHSAVYAGGGAFAQVSTGVGGEGHIFGLDAAQQGVLAGFINTYGLGGIYVGLGNNASRVSLTGENGAFETFNLARNQGNVTPVPEPTSLVLLGTGLLYGVNRMRKRQ